MRRSNSQNGTDLDVALDKTGVEADVEPHGRREGEGGNEH